MLSIDRTLSHYSRCVFRAGPQHRAGRGPYDIEKYERRHAQGSCAVDPTARRKEVAMQCLVAEDRSRRATLSRAQRREQTRSSPGGRRKQDSLTFAGIAAGTREESVPPTRAAERLIASSSQISRKDFMGDGVYDYSQVGVLVSPQCCCCHPASLHVNRDTCP